MNYSLSGSAAETLFGELRKTYDIYAPKRHTGAGRFSDTDIIRYDKISSIGDIEWREKSTYPMKEVLSPIQQALFYFTEDEFRASKTGEKPILVFAVPCDINAMDVQAKIYAGNGGFSDIYYERMRSRVKYALMDCNGGDDTCFCVSMGTNRSENYSIAVRFTEGGELLIKVKDDCLAPYFTGQKAADFEPVFVTQNELVVTVPEIPDKEVLGHLKEHPVWKQYDGRCISCGACTLACSTCTCFTTRDIIYGDNPEVGERRRVASSCQIKGFSDMAGGHGFRHKAGERIRYRVLHKYHDYKARFGEGHMCVGCGRCTSRCPEYISISATIQKMGGAIDEICAELGRKRGV